MRIISKLINNLGENVSVIDGPNNKITSQIGVPNSNDTDLIV
jgi:DNA-binding beta-propeller fold protein YncE